MISHLIRCALLALVLSTSAGCMSTGAGREFDLGFVASRDRDLNDNIRFRALGPFVEVQDSESGAAFESIRPIYSHIEQPEKDKSLTEILWPIGMFKDFGKERYWRLFPAWGRDFDNEEDGSRSRFNIFPILFTGRDTNGEKYFAIFPIGGEIHEVLGRDEVIFALFPLFARSSVRGIVTKDVLWPFVSWANGEGVHRVRVFPFYGKSVNEGAWEKKFVMWPIWTEVVYDYDDEKGHGFVLFPLYGYAKSGDKQSWMVIPPFFRYSVGDGRTEAYLPYPFIQYSSGDIDKLYLWPLWGKKETTNVRSWFVGWPIIRRRIVAGAEYESRQLTLMPLIINDSLIMKDDERVANRYFKLWPLISYKRVDDVSRLRMFDLWFARDVGSIDRNYAPLWTLFSHERVGNATDTEFLWGVYRNRLSASGSRRWSVFPLFKWEKGDEGEKKKWDFLYGFLGYEREGLRKKYKVLYFLKFGE